MRGVKFPPIGIIMVTGCEICGYKYPHPPSLTHCKECRALMEKVLSYRGLGIRCGCLQKAFRENEKKIKALEEENEE